MTNASWWANRLNGTPPAPSSALPTSYVPASRSYPPMAPPPVVDRRPTQAVASRDSGTCPECGSSNYSKVGTQSTTSGSFDVRRCFDCGYPVRQTGAGLATGNSGKPSARAAQVAGGGYNPGQIVGRIS